MNLLPASARDRWLLLLFPFKAYVFATPVCYMIWELATSGQRAWGARDEALGVVSMGYFVCFLAFAITGLLCCFLGKFDLVISAGLFGLFAFTFPAVIFNNVGILVCTISVFVFGMKFARDRSIFTPLTGEQDYPFECPVCGATIVGQAQTCPKCAWTYLK